MKDIGCMSVYGTSCDANSNGILDRAEAADTWTGYRQGNFVFGGDPNVVIPNTTVNWVWRPHAYGSASLREVSCWTDAGTVVLDIKRSDGGSMLAAPLTCTTTGATQSSMDGPGYHFIGSPYGLGFTTSGVSGVHNLSVSFKYLTSMDGNPF